MKKFRLKSEIVEAEQWFPGKEIEGVVLGCDEATCDGGDRKAEPHVHQVAYNVVSRKWVYVFFDLKPGYWVVKTRDGIFMTYKNKEFLEYFEEVI